MTSENLGDELGCLDEAGIPLTWAIADALRAPLARWGLSPKRAVLKYARGHLRAAGVEDASVTSRVLQRLVDIGECDEVYVGHEAYLAPAGARWINIGDGVAAYLGVASPPGGLAQLTRSARDLVRRVRVGGDEDAAILEAAGAREVSLIEWLTPAGYLRHAARRRRRVVRGDALPLSEFWALLEQALTEEGLTLGEGAEVRLLAGEPGRFFGRHDAPDLEGRWTLEPGEGSWCGYRRGYGDAHWHPCIISIAEGTRRVLDLYDADEWRWAVLARGRHVDAGEVARRDGSCARLTFPAPAQLRAAMDIIGSPAQAWAWRLSPGAPDLLEHLP